jgi:predicted ArsR family transcriptional regulator
MGRPGAKFKHTAEAREKITASLQGNTRSVGRVHSEETKAKMRASHLGKKVKEFSIEARNNMSIAAKNRRKHHTKV